LNLLINNSAISLVKAATSYTATEPALLIAKQVSPKEYSNLIYNTVISHALLHNISTKMALVSPTANNILSRSQKEQISSSAIILAQIMNSCMQTAPAILLVKQISSQQFKKIASNFAIILAQNMNISIKMAPVNPPAKLILLSELKTPTTSSVTILALILNIFIKTALV